MLMQAAMQNPEAVISFATDGLFSLAEHKLDCPKDKILGAWEHVQHKDITVAGAGIYITTDHDGRKAIKSRGIQPEAKAVDGDYPDEAVEAWRSGARSYTVKQHKLIGAKTALSSDTFWEMRGMFVTSTREQDISGHSVKRMWLEDWRQPHLRLEPTRPCPNWIFWPSGRERMETGALSEPHPLKWLASELAALEDEREEQDARDA
jgi:hypothetical protein